MQWWTLLPKGKSTASLNTKKIQELRTERLITENDDIKLKNRFSPLNSETEEFSDDEDSEESEVPEVFNEVQIDYLRTMYQVYFYLWGIWIEQLRVINLGIKSEDGYFIDMPPGLKEEFKPKTWEEESSKLREDLEDLQDEFNGTVSLENSDSEEEGEEFDEVDSLIHSNDTSETGYAGNWEGIEEKISPEDLVSLTDVEDCVLSLEPEMCEVCEDSGLLFNEPCPLCKTWEEKPNCCVVDIGSSINVVGSEKWVEITVDSGAADNVCPVGWAPEFGVKPCAPGTEQTFINASGAPIKHHGEKKVTLWAGEPGWERMIGLPFQACDVKKPLMAVKKICEKGNIVQFGPKASDNFILNMTTKEKIWLKLERGQYIMEATLANANPF